MMSNLTRNCLCLRSQTKWYIEPHQIEIRNNYQNHQSRRIRMSLQTLFQIEISHPMPIIRQRICRLIHCKVCLKTPKTIRIQQLHKSISQTQKLRNILKITLIENAKLACKIVIMKMRSSRLNYVRMWPHWQRPLLSVRRETLHCQCSKVKLIINKTKNKRDRSNRNL